MTVEEKAHKEGCTSGRVNGDIEINPGDTFYLGIRPIYEIEDKTMSYTLQL